MMSAFFNRAQYRSSQFIKAVGARVTKEDRALVESVLATPAQRALFDRMSVADQHHAVDILRTLRAEGYDHPALIPFDFDPEMVNSLSKIEADPGCEQVQVAI